MDHAQYKFKAVSIHTENRTVFSNVLILELRDQGIANAALLSTTDPASLINSMTETCGVSLAATTLNSSPGGLAIVLFSVVPLFSPFFPGNYNQ